MLQATWYPSMLFLRLMTYEIDHEAGNGDAAEHGSRLIGFRRACRRLLRRSDDLAVLQNVQDRPLTEEPKWSKNAKASATTADDEKAADVCPSLAAQLSFARLMLPPSFATKPSAHGSRS